MKGFKWTDWLEPVNKDTPMKVVYSGPVPNGKAEFIMPNRIEEIIQGKKDVTLDDIISKNG